MTQEEIQNRIAELNGLLTSLEPQLTEAIRVRDAKQVQVTTAYNAWQSNIKNYPTNTTLINQSKANWATYNSQLSPLQENVDNLEAKKIAYEEELASLQAELEELNNSSGECEVRLIKNGTSQNLDTITYERETLDDGRIKLTLDITSVKEQVITLEDSTLENLYIINLYSNNADGEIATDSINYFKDRKAINQYADTLEYCIPEYVAKNLYIKLELFYSKEEIVSIYQSSDTEEPIGNYKIKLNNIGSEYFSINLIELIDGTLENIKEVRLGDKLNKTLSNVFIGKEYLENPFNEAITYTGYTGNISSQAEFAFFVEKPTDYTTAVMGTTFYKGEATNSPTLDSIIAYTSNNIETEVRVGSISFIYNPDSSLMDSEEELGDYYTFYPVINATKARNGLGKWEQKYKSLASLGIYTLLETTKKITFTYSSSLLGTTNILTTYQNSFIVFPHEFTDSIEVTDSSSNCDFEEKLKELTERLEKEYQDKLNKLDQNVKDILNQNNGTEDSVYLKVRTETNEEFNSPETKSNTKGMLTFTEDKISLGLGNNKKLYFNKFLKYGDTISVSTKAQLLSFLERVRDDLIYLPSNTNRATLEMYILGDITLTKKEWYDLFLPFTNKLSALIISGRSASPNKLTIQENITNSLPLSRCSHTQFWHMKIEIISDNPLNTLLITPSFCILYNICLFIKMVNTPSSFHYILEADKGILGLYGYVYVDIEVYGDNCRCSYLLPSLFNICILDAHFYFNFRNTKNPNAIENSVFIFPADGKGRIAFNSYSNSNNSNFVTQNYPDAFKVPLTKLCPNITRACNTMGSAANSFIIQSSNTSYPTTPVKMDNLPPLLT